jgi:uncharacterized protein YgbK (DUF1537 family)
MTPRFRGYDNRVLEVLALADDLTGALETGAAFAACGLRAVVATAWREFEPVLVIDTESRHLPADEAARRVREVLRGRAARLIYKKTDSTLRGNIAAELAAVRESYPGSTVLYAPAYPALGRTVRGGRLHVHGVPVHRTAFAQDPLEPVRESSAASLAGEGVEVHDGETDCDLERSARVLRGGGIRVAAGPAAFAQAIARQTGALREIAWPRVARCLVVNGSLHEASAAQMRHARESGLDWTVFDETAIAGRGLTRAACVGRAVRDMLERSEFDAVAVFGGDTAFGILDALGRPALYPLGEVVPGVPVSEVEGGRPRYLITKAGGFGPPEILSRIRERL